MVVANCAVLRVTVPAFLRMHGAFKPPRFVPPSPAAWAPMHAVASKASSIDSRCCRCLAAPRRMATGAAILVFLQQPFVPKAASNQALTWSVNGMDRWRNWSAKRPSWPACCACNRVGAHIRSTRSAADAFIADACLNT